MNLSFTEQEKSLLPVQDYFMLPVNHCILVRAAFCNSVSYFDNFYSLFRMYFSSVISLYVCPTFTLELDEINCQCIFTLSRT